MQLDPDFVADFAQGELRAEVVRGQAVDQTKSNQDESSTSPTHHSGNYAVSPRELSLRLHEVIQSKLEERIDELEAALQNSQRKIQIMESEHKSWSEFPNSRLRYSLGQECSIAKEECNSISEPLVMNLSGEALDAYNEAYEELMKSSESDIGDSPCGVYEHISGSCSPNHVIFESQSEAMNGSMPPHSSTIQGKSLGEFFSNNLSVQLEDHICWVQGLSESSGSREEIGDFDNEMERQLIKQLVEKTKKGSPAVLNAQKLLFSMDEHEH